MPTFLKCVLLFSLFTISSPTLAKLIVQGGRDCQMPKSYLQYDMAGCLIDEMAVVGQKDKFGFVNANGELVIPIKYDNAHLFSFGLAGVKMGDYYGFIDKNNKIVIPLIYDEAFSFYPNGTAVVKKDGKRFWIDKKGNFIKNYQEDLN